MPHNKDDIDACQDIACQEIDEEIALGYLSPSAHQKYCPIHGERKPNERLVNDGEALGRDDSYGIQSSLF